MNDPKDIFNKFSLKARKVLISSQKIAQNGGSAINTEYILLALAITPGTLAYSILQEHMISLDQIRLVISLRSSPYPKEAGGISKEAKNIIEKAALIAKEFSHHQIDPEHLLSAITSSSDCLGYQIIKRIGSDPEKIKNQIQDIFSDIEDLESKPIKPPRFSAEFPISGGPNFPTPDLDDGNIAGEEMSMAEPPPMPPPPKNILDYFTVDLTSQAKNGKIDPLIGREIETQRVIQILSRRTKNNPVLVGEPGVGKTAIVEGLAGLIVEARVPEQIASKKIIMLDLALLVAGTMYRGQFEDRIKKVMDELEKLGNVILFVDELHTVVGAGSAEGSLDAANILKPALAKGKIRLIGATTTEDYRKVIEKDAALERRLQKVIVDEPSEKETIEILKGLRPRYEEYHRVTISDEAIFAAVNLAIRYIADRFLPDKAIDLIDEAAAAVTLKRTGKTSSQVINFQKQLKLIREQKELEVQNQNYQKAAEMRELEIRLSEQIKNLQADEKAKTSREIISAAEIARVVSLWTNVPVENLQKEEKRKYLNLPKNIKKQILGQDEAVGQISRAIRRSKTGIADPNRPIGSFVFLGPTGVGKTELARVLAHKLFGSREAIIKIDMSEFMERHTVSRLVGAPPGYVGYEDAGRLTEEVRRRPYSIILFDEIEKAHPEIFNILLQILEDGELTDAKGKKVNFRNTIIILTSNIGTAELTEQGAIGFKAKGAGIKKAEEEYQKMKNDILRRFKQEFRPELINRLDKIIVFRALNKTDLGKIVDLNLEQLRVRLAPQGFALKFAKNVRKLISQKGYDPQFGARPIRRAISDLIEDPLSEEILTEKIKRGDKVLVKTIKDKISFSIKSSK